MNTEADVTIVTALTRLTTEGRVVTTAAAAWIGRKNDGVIFTTDAHSFVRIRETQHPGKVSR